MSNAALGRITALTSAGEALATLVPDVPILHGGSPDRLAPPFVRIGTLVTDDPSRAAFARISDVIGPVSAPSLVLEPPRGRPLDAGIVGKDIFLATRAPPGRDGDRRGPSGPPGTRGRRASGGREQSNRGRGPNQRQPARSGSPSWRRGDR